MFIDLDSGKFTRAVSVAEFARHLCVTVQTVYAEARRGKLIISKLGRRSVILPANANAYQDNLEALGTAA